MEPTASSAEKVPDEGAEAEGDHLPDPTAARKRDEQHFAALIARAEAEPYDAAWARSSASTVEKGLTELAVSANYELVDVNCRSRSCVATLRWASYGDARAAYVRVIRESFQLNCPRGMNLPEPADPESGGSFEAKLLYHCERPN